MASEHMKGCSISLITREVHIETTMRYHYIPRTAKFKRHNSTKYWQGHGASCWQKCKIAIWKTIELFLSEIPITQPRNPLLGVYQKVVKIHVQPKPLCECP